MYVFLGFALILFKNYSFLLLYWERRESDLTRTSFSCFFPPFFSYSSNVYVFHFSTENWLFSQAIQKLFIVLNWFHFFLLFILYVNLLYFSLFIEDLFPSLQRDLWFWIIVILFVVFTWFCSKHWKNVCRLTFKSNNWSVGLTLGNTEIKRKIM